MKVAREVIKISGDYPAGVIKAAIGQLDFLVSSRFHVLIAALASNTPFVSIGWIHKFDELVEEIGIPDNNISFRGLTAECLIQRVESAWNRRNETRKRIAKEYDCLYQSAERAFHIVDKKYARWN